MFVNLYIPLTLLHLDQVHTCDILTRRSTYRKNIVQIVAFGQGCSRGSFVYGGNTYHILFTTAQAEKHRDSGQYPLLQYSVIVFVRIS